MGTGSRLSFQKTIFFKVNIWQKMIQRDGEVVQKMKKRNPSVKV